MADIKTTTQHLYLKLLNIFDQKGLPRNVWFFFPWVFERNGRSASANGYSQNIFIFIELIYSNICKYELKISVRLMFYPILLLQFTYDFYYFVLQSLMSQLPNLLLRLFKESWSNTHY